MAATLPLPTTEIFALEFLEQRYLRQVLFELASACEISSVVLVHDGIYLSPGPTAEHLSHASASAARAFRLPAFEIKYKHHSTEWQSCFEHFEKTFALSLNPFKRSRFANVSMPSPAQATARRFLTPL